MHTFPLLHSLSNFKTNPVVETMIRQHIHSATRTLTNGIPLKASEISSIFHWVTEGSKSKTWERKGSCRTDKLSRWCWCADLYGHVAGQGGEVCGGPGKRRHMRSMGRSCHRPKLSVRCQSPENTRDFEDFFDSISPVGELHIQSSISLVTDHVVQRLPRAFWVRQCQVAPGVVGSLVGKVR